MGRWVAGAVAAGLPGRVLTVGGMVLLALVMATSTLAVPDADLPPPDPGRAIDVNGRPHRLGWLVLRATGGEVRAQVPAVDLFALGVQQLRAGAQEQALALLRSLPADDDDYPAAQRLLAWELYTLEVQRPAWGLGAIHRALAAAPLDAGNWRVAARVTLRTAATLFTGAPVTERWPRSRSRR